MNEPLKFKDFVKFMGILIVVLAIGFGLTVGIMMLIDRIKGVGTSIPQEEVQSLLQSAPEFLALCKQVSGASSTIPDESPQRLEEYKFVIVDIKTGELDKEFFQLNSEIRASNKEEITTLVCVDRQTVYRFSYVSGGSAYRHVIGYIAFDWPNEWRKTYGRFPGSEPPKTKALAGDAYGSEPKGKIAEWCKQYALTKGDPGLLPGEVP